MASLRDGNAVETLLMTAQINTDLVNHHGPLTTEPSTSLVRVGTDACKSIINSILRYKGYFSQKQFVDNRHMLLDLARMVFEEQSTIERIVYRIMTHTQSLLQCERCQVLLVDENTKRYRTLNCNKKTMYYSIDMNFFYSKDNFVALHFKYDQARRRFVEWAQNEVAVVPDFHKRILFSDEAHFWLNGYVNKQNCRILNEANPQVYVEAPLHPEKLTVWCALWAGGIIGPYFFKNDEGQNVAVNDDRYRAMITNFFIPELNNHDVQELWFQQDGATCHTARATIDLLMKDTFGDRLISRFGLVN
ncbi:uncharacterized protein TNCV_3448231 [Trichonephila clavipes]|nr:uncharacterized protein TNCV_3448231 [Trichonephila clavipes]